MLYGVFLARDPLKTEVLMLPRDVSIFDIWCQSPLENVVHCSTLRLKNFLFLVNWKCCFVYKILSLFVSGDVKRIKLSSLISTRLDFN